MYFVLFGLATDTANQVAPFTNCNSCDVNIFVGSNVFRTRVKFSSCDANEALPFPQLRRANRIVNTYTPAYLLAAETRKAAGTVFYDASE